MRKLWLLAAAASLLLVARAPQARAQDLSVVATCGTLSLSVGYGVAPATQDQTGKLCTNANGGGGPTAGIPTGTTTDASGTVAVANTYQTVQAATLTRRGCTLQNTSVYAETVKVNTTIYTLAAGQAFFCAAAPIVVTDQIQITSATAGASFSAGFQ